MEERDALVLAVKGPSARGIRAPYWPVLWNASGKHAQVKQDPAVSNGTRIRSVAGGRRRWVAPSTAVAVTAAHQRLQWPASYCGREGVCVARRRRAQRRYQDLPIGKRGAPRRKPRPRACGAPRVVTTDGLTTARLRSDCHATATDGAQWVSPPGRWSVQWRVCIGRYHRRRVRPVSSPAGASLRPGRGG